MYQLGEQKRRQDEIKESGAANKRGGLSALNLPEPIAKIKAGKTHSLFLTKGSGRVYAVGDNKYAQTGQNPVDYPVVEQPL